MATKKTSAASKNATTKKTTAVKKSTTTKKTAAKPKTTAKKTVTKKTATATKPVAKKANVVETKKPIDIYNTNVSILLAMAIEALILLLGYLIIMSAA